jgi:hypothetical protein
MKSLQQKSALADYANELSKKGLIPFRFIEALLDFSLFYYCFAVFFTSTFALLYYRKFRSLV